ncbi:MAG: hypothetical protein QOE70_969 [Chthoniobacter sp.]|jgi:hypothetical protein|nr:hypothetical protein [Chthoniobacter sp.]
MKKSKFYGALFCGENPKLPEVQKADLKVVARPTRVLQMARRGDRSPFSAPPIILPERSEPPWCRVAEYLLRDDVARQLLQSPCRLRRLQASNEANWSRVWEELAQLLWLLKLVDQPYTVAEIEAVNAAGDAECCYHDAREGYAAMVETYGVPVARGDWGACMARTWSGFGRESISPSGCRRRNTW